MYNNKFFQRIGAFAISTLLITASVTAVFAATSTYKLKDINTQVDIPSNLSVITRNVTSADPALSIIDASFEEIQITFSQYGIHLEAFPEDVAYEIVISGQDETSIKNLTEMNNSEFNEGLQTYKEQCESVETDDVYEVASYSNNSARYYTSEARSLSNDITVYIQKYYTVVNGKAISYSIQSNGVKLTDEHKELLKSIVDSAVYKEINSSITDSTAFREIGGTIFGIVFSIGALGLILFLMNKSTKKSSK